MSVFYESLNYTESQRIEQIKAAVAAERERIAKLVESAAERQDEEHVKANGWYVADGGDLRQIAEQIRSSW